MDYPCGPPLIFEDEFYQSSKQILGTLNTQNCAWSVFIIRVIGSSYFTLVQIFFLQFNLMGSF